MKLHPVDTATVASLATSPVWAPALDYIEQGLSIAAFALAVAVGVLRVWINLIELNKQRNGNKEDADH